MATKIKVKPKFRIFIHGNNGFKSKELLDNFEIYPESNYSVLEEIEFFSSSDLNLNARSSARIPNSEISGLIEESYQGVEVSAILVLISLTEIFSEGMHTMIQKLPYSKFYGFNQRNEKEWWKHVIIVFSMGAIGYEKDSQVKKSIARNGGIKQIVKQAGNRYIWISDSTEPGELVQKLRDVMQPMKKELIVGVTHLPGYEETMDAFRRRLNKSRAEAIKGQGIHRRFILFGEEQSKSSLGNWLSGKAIFPTHLMKQTEQAKGFPINEMDVCGEISYGNKLTDESDELSKMFKIQLVDQTEVSKPKLYGKYLANCISEIQYSDHVTFLITIDLNSQPLSREEFSKINDAALILSTRNLDFYSNAIIVFTHLDESVNYSEDDLRKMSEEMLQQEDHVVFLKKLLKLVEQRSLFLNVVNFSISNRKEALEKLFPIGNQNGVVNDVFSENNPEQITISVEPNKMKSEKIEEEIKSGGLLGCIGIRNFRRNKRKS